MKCRHWNTCKPREEAGLMGCMGRLCDDCISSVQSTSSLAEAIEAMLHDKGAFRDTLPPHLDWPKFRWIVRRDILRVIEDHVAANAEAHGRAVARTVQPLVGHSESGGAE